MVYYFVINVVFLVCLTTVVFVDILLINYFDSKGRKCPSEQRGERSYSSPTIGNILRAPRRLEPVLTTVNLSETP